MASLFSVGFRPVAMNMEADERSVSVSSVEGVRKDITGEAFLAFLLCEIFHTL